MNRQASEYADAHGLRHFSGTDCHEEEWLGRCGIYTEVAIMNIY